MKSEVLKLYDTLSSRYGDLNWWPAKSPYEVMVGAVLTQNTAWSNVEKAIDNFFLPTKDYPTGRLTPELIETATLEELSQIIKPSGFFNQKAVYLKELTKWYKQYDYSVETVKSHELGKLRKELLCVKGIGDETADSILLYAFEKPTFVVDSYTKRLLKRLKTDVDISYYPIKKYFEDNLQGNEHLYNNFHALIVINAKEHCKVKPKCGTDEDKEEDRCPLYGRCTI